MERPEQDRNGLYGMYLARLGGSPELGLHETSVNVEWKARKE